METTTIPPRPECYGGDFTPPPNSAGLHRPFPSPELFQPPAASPKPPPKTTSTPPCTECGKRFSSWKALFGHMRCHPERQWRGINPPPCFRRPLLLPPPPPPHADFTDDEHDVAASLIMLANGPPSAISSLSFGHRFGCASCGRSFRSQQALGRHRASHKKRPWEEHKCNVCCKGFATGQALGGHMRSHHWEKGEEHVAGCSNSNGYLLDLNFAPPVETNEGWCSISSPALDLKLGWL